MSTNQLLIPEKINVGFQNRSGTYTGKLAYVIYYDHKGVLRKEKSWQSWRDKKINPVEYPNEPTEGFVLNKGVGGQKQSWGWHARNEYIRVYDPRDFEFEISVANLLFILRECDCSRGKGLEGKFVYAWQGTELILLPVNSVDYEQSQKYTELQASSGVKAKDLIPGATYLTRKLENLVYLGRFEYYDIVQFKSSATVPKAPRKYVFHDGKNFIYLNDVKSIATVVNADVLAPNYAELVEKYQKSRYGSKAVKLFLREGKELGGHHDRYWYYQSGDYFVKCWSDWWGTSTNFSYADYRYFLKDGFVIAESYSVYMGENNARIPGYYNRERVAYRERTHMKLWALLESGTKIQISY